MITPTGESKSIAAPCSLPLEGKGDRAAVDEVCTGDFVSRGFFDLSSSVTACAVPPSRDAQHLDWRRL